MAQALILAALAMAILFGPGVLSLILWARVRALERTVVDLERRLAGPAQAVALPVAPPVDAPVPEPAAPMPAPAIAATPLPPPPVTLPTVATAKTGFDWEHLVAGQWLNRIGLVAVAVGVAYFLKYAIDNDWIGPSGQVALGVLFGSGLLASTPWLLKRRLVYFADGVTGLGAAVLYLSLWAAGSYYQLLPPAATFVAMAVVTAAMVAIAAGRRSVSVAVMAMIGGFVAPALVSTGRDAQVELFTYLALHDTALLVLAWRRDWRVLELPAFVLTQAYFLAWCDRFYTSERIVSTSAFALWFFVQFSAIPVLRSRRAGGVRPEQAAVASLAAFAFLLVLRYMLWPDHRWTLAAVTLAVAALYLVVARAAASDAPDGAPVKLLFAGLALTFATIAIPLSLDGPWITLAWSVEAAVLMWTGAAARRWYLRAASLVLFALVGVRLATFPIDAAAFLWNARLGVALATAGSALIALWKVWQSRLELSEAERLWLAVLAVGTNVLLLAALTGEVQLYYAARGELVFDLDRRLAESLVISLLWTAFAAVLLTAGLRLSSALLRWQGLVLLAVVSLKLFFADLAFLRGFYRIISSIALGVVLIGISYLYQRRLMRGAADGGPQAGQ